MGLRYASLRKGPAKEHLLLGCFLVFWLCHVSAQTTTEEPTISTDWCCKNINWGGGWCKAGNCLGEYCGDASCPDLSNCICNGKISYKSKSFCSVVQACNEAEDDLKAASIRVQELTGSLASEIVGCEDAIRGVVCAYHFPRCTDDQTDFTDVCLGTCWNMYDTCVKAPDCQPGENVTQTDANGNEVEVPCNATARRRISSHAQEALEDSLLAQNSHLRNAKSSSKIIQIVEDVFRPRHMIDGIWVENEPGKIKLTDFAQRGDRCKTCLSAEEIERGTDCPTDSLAYAAGNSDCTAAATTLMLKDGIIPVLILVHFLCQRLWL